jgi:hypothetical protein
MNIVATGWVSIHPLHRTWRLHLSANNTPHALLVRKKLRLQFGTWKKTLFITQKRPSPQAIKTKVRIGSQQNRFTIGPLIGILTVAGGSLFRGVQSNFIDIIATGRKMGALVYVVPIENINWKLRTVQGYLFNPNGNKWIKKSLPLPHVLYNRIPNRTFEKKPHVKIALKQLSTMHNLTLYNPSFFNKQQLYAALQRDPSILSYLPRTIPLKNKQTLYDMLTFYPFVYVKPFNGMAGQGIYRVQRKPSDEYLVQYQERKKTVNKLFHNREEMWKYLAPKVKRKYLVQQGIDLATFDNKLFDIRLLAQKNGCGEWDVTGMGIRLAGSGKITTHVPRGGSVQPPEAILSATFSNKKSEKLLVDIRNMALSIARSLEKEWPALGEVSMDIGIDKAGRIWFIEANAKPGKFDEPHIRKLSLQRIVEYAQHQANFTEKRERPHVHL